MIDPTDQFRYDGHYLAHTGLLDFPAVHHHINMTYDTGPVADEPIVVFARDVARAESGGADNPADPGSNDAPPT